MNTDSNECQSLACDLTAIPADVREEHVLNAPQLFAWPRRRRNCQMVMQSAS
jgi:hypothetical protein